jgi:uncharacterized protein (UPF0147 family)
MKEHYAIIYIDKAMYVMTEVMFNHYVPPEVRLAALRAGKAWKRNKEQNRRAKEKFKDLEESCSVK